MKNFIVIACSLFFIMSCQPCRECKYPTQKGFEVETLCSSIKEDRIAFEQRFDSIANFNGVKAVCTKETY